MVLVLHVLHENSMRTREVLSFEKTLSFDNLNVRESRASHSRCFNGHFILIPIIPTILFCMSIRCDEMVGHTFT